MDFWPEFLASSSRKEFVAGGCGGMAGIMAGYPLDTLRVKQQHSKSGSSAFSIIRQVVASGGPRALYKGMSAPLASVTFQNAMVFQNYAILSRTFDKNQKPNDPPSFKGVALGGFGTGAIQSLILSPVELVKIRLQLQSNPNDQISERGPMNVALRYNGIVDCFKRSVKEEGYNVLCRGLGTAVIRAFIVNGAVFTGYETAVRFLST